MRLAALLVPAAAVLLAVLLASTTPASAAPAVDPVVVHARAAVAYAKTRHVSASIAVIDTTTGHVRTGGSRTRHYAAASTAKVLTAVVILARHKLTKANRADMWAMITRSDNAAWARLSAQVGWGHVVTAVEKRYHVGIGSEPAVHTHVGETMVTAAGMARMYAAVKKDGTVWPWLHRAMAHISPKAAGGVDQLFGIPAAKPVGGYALKQGWLRDTLDGRSFGVMHSTGYVDHYRYVVCVYTTGTASMYDGVARGTLGRTISAMARRLLPHGRVE